MRPPRPTEDTFAALVRLFLSPANPKALKWTPGTRRAFERELNFMARPDILGAKSRYELRRAVVQGYFDAIADRPGKQAMALAALRLLERWAIGRDLLTAQFTIGVEIGHSDGGHIPWTDEQVALAERHAAPELARAVTLVANTGQRGSDLIRMGWADIEEYRGIRGINVRQQKTGRQLWIPITTELGEAMRGWARTLGPFLLRADGTAWTRHRITNAWTDERDGNAALSPLCLPPASPVAGRAYLTLAAGTDAGKDTGLVLHGLRGTACVRLRRAGATESEIAAMVGMSIEMVARYCRFSLQRESAATAAAKLDRTFAERLAAKTRASDT